MWTALHQNIDPSRNKWRRLLHKLGWTGLAILAPEVVVWRAVAQLAAAQALCKTINEKTESLEKAQEKAGISNSQIHSDSSGREMRQSTEQNKWSLTLGFFAVMGGFKIPMDVKDDQLTDGGTLTPSAVLFLATLGYLPHVDEQTIEDKSKADSLGKGLVCIQVGWMVIQTISRKASGLPITLLELNTMAHVACAVVMYLVWWYKPQNVSLPLTIDTDLFIGLIMRGDDLGILQTMAPSNDSQEHHEPRAAYRGENNNPEVAGPSRWRTIPTRGGCGGD